jgi:hypothetical protein
MAMDSHMHGRRCHARCEGSCGSVASGTCASFDESAQSRYPRRPFLLEDSSCRALTRPRVDDPARDPVTAITVVQPDRDPIRTKHSNVCTSMWKGACGTCVSRCVCGGGGGGLKISKMMTQCSSVNDVRCLFVCLFFVFCLFHPAPTSNPRARLKTSCAWHNVRLKRIHARRHKLG